MKTKKLFCTASLVATMLFSCHNEELESGIVTNTGLNELEETILNFNETPFKSVEDLKPYEDFMKQVLAMAKNTEFREQASQLAQLQKSGDYDFKIKDLQQRMPQFNKSIAGMEPMAQLIETNDAIFKRTGLTPVVFYPRAESLETQTATYRPANPKKSSKEPVAVFKGVYAVNYDAPGYILNDENELVFSHMVSEEEAWTNDVYVIGPPEPMSIGEDDDTEDDPNACDCNDGGGYSGGGSNNPPQNRTEGYQEYGGNIQITDINAIEHWTAGKLEMRIIVVSATGTVVKDKQFPKRARNNFTGDKWFDFNEFLFYWNTPNITPFTVEKWMETDYGFGTETEVSISVPASSSGGPATTIKRDSRSGDEDLGQTIVQFSDPLNQIYGISSMNFKRK